MQPASFPQLGADIISLVEQNAAGKWPEAEALQKKAMNRVAVSRHPDEQRQPCPCPPRARQVAERSIQSPFKTRKPPMT